MNITGIIGVILGALLTLFGLFVISLKGLIYLCQPNEVLIFSGKRRREGAREFGYRVQKGGRTWRIPFLERVDRLDLTNMIIELEARGAYAKGGVPLNVHGVANVKIAGHEPILNNAIERFLGKSRTEIAGIARATLEGSLRGVLATLTPEQLNEDRNLFAERLVQEVEHDLTQLGLVVDTLKIQNITDDVRYLDSIGRIRNSELLSTARVAEAVARADASVRQSENNEREIESSITAQLSVARADAERALADARSRRAAVVAEEEAIVAAQVAKAKAELEVQRARLEQVRKQLEADVVQPARAECEAMEQRAKADVAGIVEEGRARAEALKSLAKSWTEAGDQARQIFLMQKLEPIIDRLTDVVGETTYDRVTVIDQRNVGDKDALNPGRLLALNEQFKEVMGVDLADKLRKFGETPAPLPIEPAPAPVVRQTPKVEAEPEPEEPTAPPLPKTRWELRGE